MATLDSPRNSALLAIALAAGVGYIGYTGEVLNLVGMGGIQARQEQVTALADSVVLLEASVDSAKRELARGSVEEVRQRAEDSRAALATLRQFVPEEGEVPNLLDDISTRAKVRGVNLAGVVPRPVEPGPAPFDTHRYELAVIGPYDAIGEFLTDVASLRRIIVPGAVQLKAADAARARALGDTTQVQLEARFLISTFVKSATGGGDAP